MGKKRVGTEVGLEPGTAATAVDQGVIVGVDQLFPAPRRRGQAKESVGREPGCAGQEEIIIRVRQVGEL